MTLLYTGLLILSVGAGSIVIFLWRNAVNKSKELARKLSSEKSTNSVLKQSLKREKALTVRLRNELQKANKLLEEHVSPGVLIDNMFGPKNSGSS